MNLFNHEFESSVIGAIMLDPSCLFDVMPIITSKSFHSAFCRDAYASVLELDKNGVGIDIIALSDHLERADPDTDWISWLATIAKNFYSTRSVIPHAKHIKEYEEMRNLLEAGQSIVDVCTDPDLKLSQKIDHAQQSILDLQTSESTDPVMSKELLREFIDHIEECGKNGGGLSGIPTGFDDFDQACGGLHGSELIILAARPGMGKTNLALNFTSNMINQGKSVLFFSLEMSRTQLMGRLCAARSMLDYDRILKANFNEDEYRHFTSFVGTMNKTNFAIDDRAGLSVNEIRSKARKHKMKHGLDMIVVDYLQLISGTGESETVIVSNISKELKRISKDLDVPVVALSQLNRKVEDRADKRPIPSDLRQSGSIEQDADIILFLYRDVVYNKQCPSPHLAEMIIAKLRHGQCQTITLDTQFNKCRFLPTSEIAQGFVADEPKKSFASRQRG